MTYVPYKPNERIPNDGLREFYLRNLETGRMTSLQMARKFLGADDASKNELRSATSLMKRKLGLLAPKYVRKGKTYHNLQKNVTPSTAFKLMEAMNADPFEVGL